MGSDTTPIRRRLDVALDAATPDERRRARRDVENHALSDLVELFTHLAMAQKERDGMERQRDEARADRARNLSTALEWRRLHDRAACEVGLMVEEAESLKATVAEVEAERDAARVELREVCEAVEVIAEELRDDLWVGDDDQRGHVYYERLVDALAQAGDAGTEGNSDASA